MERYASAVSSTSGYNENYENSHMLKIEIAYRMPKRRPILPALDLLGRKAFAL